MDDPVWGDSDDPVLHLHAGPGELPPHVSDLLAQLELVLGDGAGEGDQPGHHRAHQLGTHRQERAPQQQEHDACSENKNSNIT